MSSAPGTHVSKTGVLIEQYGFPGDSGIKSLEFSAGDMGSVSGLGTSPSNPLQYSCLGSFMGYRPWGHKRGLHDLVTKQQLRNK